MDWTVRPLTTTNVQAKDFQVQGPYQSQQPPSGFSQANVSPQNSSAYTGNDQAIKIRASTDNVVANQLPSPNTVGSNSFQPPLLRMTVPVTGFGTTQHFIDLNAGSHVQPPSLTVQMTAGTAKNVWPNSNVHTFSPVTPQHSTGNPAQQPLIQYMASDMYNNHLQKNGSNSVQASVLQGNKNSSCSNRLPMMLPRYRPPNSQTNATVPLNQVSSHFIKSQQNSLCLTFPSGQNVKNQINSINSGSTTAMQSQQYAPNFVYSSPYSIQINQVGQAIPQATHVSFLPPKYPVSPTQIKHGQLVPTQPVSNMSILDQHRVPSSVQHSQILPASVPIARETNEVAGTANSVHRHRAEDQPYDELTKTAVNALKSLCNTLEKVDTLPHDKMSPPQTTRVTTEGNVAESPENALDRLAKLKPITRESLELDRQKICELRKKFLTLQAAFKLKRSIFLSSEQKSMMSDPSVHNPNHSLPSSNTNQNLPVMLSQAAPSREATQNLAFLRLHGNNQNQSPLSCFSNPIQDESLLLLRTKSHLYPILQELLKGTSDEEMLLNTHIANTERNQSKQLFVSEKHSSGSPPVSSVNGTQNASRLSPKTSETVSTQESLTCSLGFEKTSASNKDQLTNVSAMVGGDPSDHFVVNKNEVGTPTTKALTNIQNPASVQNPTVSSESLHKREMVAEGSEDFQKFKSYPEFIQQSKKTCLQIPEKNITPSNNGSDISSSASLAAAIPEAAIVQKTSVTGNSCTVGRTCSLEELETSLALWRKSSVASLRDQLGESTESTMNSSSDAVEANKMQYTLKNVPNILMHNEGSSIAVGNSETPQSSSLGQKTDAVSSSSLKSSEPQVAIVPPLILSKEGTWKEEREKNQSCVLETMYPVVESSVFSLHEFSLTTSAIDKPVERIPYSPSDTCVTVKKVDSDVYQKTTKTTEEIGIRGAETGTNYSCDPLEMKKITPHVCPREMFSPGTSNGSSRPVSQKCAPESSPDLVKPGDTVLNANMFQISSVCTLVQGDAFYNSQIASIFSTSSLKSEVENNTSSEDCMPDSYNKEQQADLRKKESEMNGSTPVQDTLSPSLGTLSKAIAERLLSLKMSQGGTVSHEMNIRDSEEEKITYLPKGNPNSGKESEQNTSCDDVHSADLASGNQDVPENKLLFSDDNENSTYGMQEYVPNNENQAHSLNNIDIALTLPNDQLTELLKEFPYGIDNSQALKKIKNEDSATKLVERKGGEETQTSGHNSEANDTLDQIVITVLNSEQMKELFPQYSCQSSNKLDSKENNHLSIASADTNNLRKENESHVQPDQAILVKSTNTSAETVKKPANSYCCLTGWLSSEYALDPCACMLAKEAALKQQLDERLLSESISKERPQTNKNSNAGRLNNQHQSISPIGLPLEAQSNRILDKTIVPEDCDVLERECKPLKEGKELNPLPFSEKLEPLIHKNKEDKDKVQIDEMRNQKCKTLVSVSQKLSFSRTGGLNRESIRPPHKKELPYNQKTPRETVVDKSKKDTVHLRNMENKQSRKNERYKIKQDSSETHIIKGPIYNLNKGLKQTVTEKHKTFKRPRSTVTNSSNLSSIGSLSKMYDNVQHAQEHFSKQKCQTERDLENGQAVRTEHNKSSSSEPVQQNKGKFVRTNLKKFAYSEERGNAWKYRRSLSANGRTSKVQTHRGPLLKIHKLYSSVKDPVWGTSKRDKCFERTVSDKNSPCSRKGNIVTLQRDQKKSYLNKVAFRQTAQSICLTNLQQSPSKSVWHVKSNRTLEYPEESKKGVQSFQQPEVVKPQMLEFKMCPETVFRNLVLEDVPDAKKLPEKETIPVSAVKSKREDWLHYSPLKRRKSEERESQADDQIPLDTALELLEKNEAVHVPVKASNATFQTYRKMHLEKRSRSLDSSPQN